MMIDALGRLYVTVPFHCVESGSCLPNNALSACSAVTCDLEALCFSQVRDTYTTCDVSAPKRCLNNPMFLSFLFVLSLRFFLLFILSTHMVCNQSDNVMHRHAVQPLLAYSVSHTFERCAADAGGSGKPLLKARGSLQAYAGVHVAAFSCVLRICCTCNWYASKQLMWCDHVQLTPCRQVASAGITSNSMQTYCTWHTAASISRHRWWPNTKCARHNKPTVG
jgi:hypothetical protein